LRADHEDETPRLPSAADAEPTAGPTAAAAGRRTRSVPAETDQVEGVRSATGVNPATQGMNAPAEQLAAGVRPMFRRAFIPLKPANISFFYEPYVLASVRF
jgi:hypothetical protein